MKESSQRALVRSLIELGECRVDVAGGEGEIVRGGDTTLGIDTESNALRAFDQLFREEYPSVLRAASVIVNDTETARDVAQEAFTKLYVNWAKVSRYDRPGAWVRRVAINDAIRAGERDQRRRAAMGRFARRPSTSAPSLDDNGDPDDDVMAAVATLSPRQRAVVILFYLQDLTVAEIADASGMSPATVKVHLHRARENLAEVLTEEVSSSEPR